MLFVFSWIKANLGRVKLGSVVLNDHIVKILEKRLILVWDRHRLHLEWFKEVIRIMVLSVCQSGYIFTLF